MGVSVYKILSVEVNTVGDPWAYLLKDKLGRLFTGQTITGSLQAASSSS